jgi:hypothetical protein
LICKRIPFRTQVDAFQSDAPAFLPAFEYCDGLGPPPAPTKVFRVETDSAVNPLPEIKRLSLPVIAFIFSACAFISSAAEADSSAVAAFR